MTPARRQAVFQQFFAALAREHARRHGLGYAGTIRKLPPPPLPGEGAGATRYYLNAVSADGRSSGLVELAGPAEAALQRAERWAESGRGAAPRPPAAPKLKRKV
jgi:hypothetical protein